MADVKLKHPENAPGPLFVDTTCIDCGTCYHLGPEIFREHRESSVVRSQPRNLEEWSQAKAALVSCPTNSIGVRSAPAEFREASEDLPKLISETVFYCGYTSRDSYGASSYLIQRPEGNILVDSPRFHPLLVKKIEEAGGVALMYLSHRDDVADHEQFAEHFKCQRIIHRLDVGASTRNCEMILEGTGDWDLSPEVKIIFTPGHTRGHLCLLYKEKYLFTGDHLFYSSEEDKIYASKSVSWYSWEEQLESVRKLLPYHYDWILPGHGGWVQKDEKLIKADLRSLTAKGSPEAGTSP